MGDGGEDDDDDDGDDKDGGIVGGLVSAVARICAMMKSMAPWSPADGDAHER